MALHKKPRVIIALGGINDVYSILFWFGLFFLFVFFHLEEM